MLALLTLLGALQQAAPVEPPRFVPVTLDGATARGVARSSAVAAAIGAVREPRGARAEAFWPFPDNPVFEVGRLRREIGTLRTNDRTWGVSQDIDISGQWLARSKSAGAFVRSAEALVEDARRLARFQVRSAYASLYVSERREEFQDSAAVFARRLADFARRQFDAGETNRLELNTAILESSRAHSVAERTRAARVAAAADLARLLALPPDSLPATTDLPPVPELRWSNLEALLAIARLRRPDLEASRSARDGANRAVSATRRGAIPALNLSVQGGRESTDRLLGIGLGIRVPLFHRQQAATGAAEAGRATAVAWADSIERLVPADVRTAAERFLRARSAHQQFAAVGIPAAVENVRLTERALLEGEVSLTEVLVLRGTAVAAQLEYLDVLSDVTLAWFELAAALAAEPTELLNLLQAGPR